MRLFQEGSDQSSRIALPGFDDFLRKVLFRGVLEQSRRDGAVPQRRGN